MPTLSDLGHDPIIPLTHDTFMDHSPFGPLNLLDPSRTSPMKSSETFPNSEIGLFLYESYSPDILVIYRIPSETPNNIRYPCQHSLSTKQHRILKCVSLRFVNYAEV